MKESKMIKAAWFYCLLPFSMVLAAEGEKSLSLFTGIDLGRLESGYDLKNHYDPSGVALNRTYVDVGFQQKMDDKYLISVGVGGIFWKAYEVGGGLPDEKVIKFGPGISNAYFKWMPIDQLSLTFGYLPYKYNNAAKNLGEYLFRAEAYPTILYTGGWVWMNDVQYHSVAAVLSHNAWDGRFRQDVGFFGELFNAPIYDITPAYIATLHPAAGVTIGGAAALHRYISPTPRTKKELTKSYEFRRNFYMPAFAGDTLFDLPPRAAGRQNMLHKDIIRIAGEEGSDSATYFGLPENQGSVVETVSFDLAAIYALAFFELDFNAMLGLEEDAMGKFNLYGEVAQLGFKDYPIFFTEKSQRRPIMLGLSVPTGGILDHISFEIEYLKNPNIESIASTYDKLDLPPDEEFRYKVYSDDDLKWSVHASRSLSSYLTLFVQVANDHMRLKNGFAQPQYVPVTQEKSHWYWLTRIQWAI